MTTATPLDLAAYRRVQRFVEQVDPGAAYSLPEQERPAYLRIRTRRWWDALRLARAQYRTRREASAAVGWPYDR